VFHAIFGATTASPWDCAMMWRRHRQSITRVVITFNAQSSPSASTERNTNRSTGGQPRTGVTIILAHWHGLAESAGEAKCRCVEKSGILRWEQLFAKKPRRQRTV